MTSSPLPPVRPPKISIFIPCYNYARYVGRAMESVLAQTDPDLELIVVDNGSTDESWSVIQSFTDPRVRSFRIEKNEGVCPAWAFGLEKCRGEWFSLLSADDCLLPRKHEILLRYLDSHPEIDAVGGFIQQVDEHGERSPEPRWMEQIINEPRDLNSLDAWMMRHYLCIPTALYRRSLCTAPAESGNAVCDYHFHLRLLRCGCRFGLVPEALACYRVHSENTTLREQFSAPLQFAYAYAVQFLPWLRESGQVQRAGEGILVLFKLFEAQLRGAGKHDLGGMMLCLFWPDWVAQNCPDFQTLAAVEWETRQDGHHFHAVRAMVDSTFSKWTREAPVAAPAYVPEPASAPELEPQTSPPPPATEMPAKREKKGWLRETGRQLERRLRHWVRGKKTDA